MGIMIMNIERTSRLTSQLAAFAAVRLNSALSSNWPGNQIFNLRTRVQSPLALSHRALGSADSLALSRAIKDPIPIAPDSKIRCAMTQMAWRFKKELPWHAK